MKEEIWKDIPNYEGFYQASSLGRVRSLDRTIEYGKERVKRKVRGQIMKPYLEKHGYLSIRLAKEKRGKYLVSQLIAMAFLNHTPNGHTLVVNHIDGIRTNNKLSNLEIVTNRENSSIYKIDNGIHSKYLGVTRSQSKKNPWLAQIQHNNKNIYLGLFETEVKAHHAYKRAYNKLIK